MQTVLDLAFRQHNLRKIEGLDVFYFDVLILTKSGVLKTAPLFYSTYEILSDINSVKSGNEYKKGERFELFEIVNSDNEPFIPFFDHEMQLKDFNFGNTENYSHIMLEENPHYLHLCKNILYFVGEKAKSIDNRFFSVNKKAFFLGYYYGYVEESEI